MALAAGLSLGLLAFLAAPPGRAVKRARSIRAWGKGPMGEAERGQECKGCCADRRSFGIPGIPDSDTSVVFLGTGSKTIQESRSIPSIGVRRTTQNNPHVLLFNTGEGTHLSLLRSSVQPKYIRRILVSSLSLENILGLPSLLVIITKALAASYKANEPMQLANDNKPDALEIIGPEGLRAWIRVNLKLTNTRLQFPIRIRELRNVPFVHPTIQKPPKNHSKSLYPSDLDGYPPLLLKRAHAEVPGDSQDIFPVVTSIGAIWEILDDRHNKDGLRLRAAAINAAMPTVGYVIDEAKKGVCRMRSRLVQQLISKNSKQLSQTLKVKPGRVFKMIETLAEKQEFIFPDGTRVCPKDVFQPSRPGRKISIVSGGIGVTDQMALMANQSDLLIQQNQVHLNGVASTQASKTQLNTTGSKVIVARMIAFTNFDARSQARHQSALSTATKCVRIMRKKENINNTDLQHINAGELMLGGWEHLELPVPSRDRQLAADRLDELTKT